jgi:hypothetical protein
MATCSFIQIRRLASSWPSKTTQREEETIQPVALACWFAAKFEWQAIPTASHFIFIQSQARLQVATAAVKRRRQ